ncbi:MAG TPA: AMP-binding protein [Symbiobacteriaceae bacterium]|nr:AMP-binding protein [Symbiobacteriaceae bacterium]
MPDRPYFQPEIETMSRGDLALMQVGHLQQQVRFAAASPFYRRLWGGEPVIRTIDDVRRLPFLHKQDLVAAHLREPPLGDLPVRSRTEWREVYPIPAVSESAYTVYAEADLARSAEIGARILWACGLRPGDLVHNGFNYGLFAGGIFIHRSTRAMGATVIPIGTDSVKRQVEFLFNLKPAMLVGAPSHVLYLAERIRERGLAPREIGVRIGLFGAEPGAAEAVSRARLEAIFGCRAYDLYGITEVGVVLAGECQCQQGLHWAEDHVLVEVIDPRTHNACQPGEQGVLVLTDLTRRNMPLLRYWTGDMTTLAWTPCPCGRTHARSVGGIAGRTYAERLPRQDHWLEDRRGIP